MGPKLTWAAADVAALALMGALIGPAPARAADPQASDACGQAGLSAEQQRACASSEATPASVRGPASALSPETACENGKLRAAGAYAECLARAASTANAVGGELDDAPVERCNDRFDRVFEWGGGSRRLSDRGRSGDVAGSDPGADRGHARGRQKRAGLSGDSPTSRSTPTSAC